MGKRKEIIQANYQMRITGSPWNINILSAKSNIYSHDRFKSKVAILGSKVSSLPLIPIRAEQNTLLYKCNDIFHTLTDEVRTCASTTRSSSSLARFCVPRRSPSLHVYSVSHAHCTWFQAMISHLNFVKVHTVADAEASLSPHTDTPTTHKHGVSSPEDGNARCQCRKGLQFHQDSC